jgi:bidirectional [NiFe] hydrogenase diaphorase subunit
VTESELLELAERQSAREAGYRCRIDCCLSGSCLSSGSMGVFCALRDAVREGALSEALEVIPTGCMGPCSKGPLVRVASREGPDVLYQSVTSGFVPDIIAGAVSGSLAHSAQVLSQDSPFFRRQRKVVLENTGLIDPESAEHAVAHGGYRSLAQVLREWSPAEACEAITRSGLRGRGGAGYPTGVKWNLVRKAAAAEKYVIANGDEGDPGAYMDRAIMEGDPHRVIEGMAIAAYAVGARSGYVYVRGEYPTAVRRLGMAIRAATKLGLLGRAVLGTKFDFDVDVRIGAGAFVCGEETALIASIEGGRGTPRPRPPYPAESGLFGRPTLINNVETLAAVPAIIHMGVDRYAEIGTATSKGTKVFALSGAVVNTGLIEVPMGTTLREIVFEIGGGIPGGRALKAVQTGGPSGGCIPAEHLDLPVDYESLQHAGSIMGSGGMVVMGEDTSMVDVARFFVGFCRDESCGKCIPCRAGTVQMHRLLDRIYGGAGTLDDLELLEDLCDVVKHTSLCGLGQSAPNPVLSTLRYFRQEYLDRIGGRRRPRGPSREDERSRMSLPLVRGGPVP